MRRLRPATAVVATTVLALTASGCVTVHGELELVPAVTKSEAEQALKDFTDAYNKADKAYDPALDAGRVTGPLGAINQAGLKARSVTSPGGNPRHRPLELTDAKFTIPKKAGWPRWFVADTDANRDRAGAKTDDRWLLVFVRNGNEQLWEVAHLAILTPDEVPVFKQKDGYAVPVAANSQTLAVAPKDLGTRYVSYLRTGEPGMFAPGAHTTFWRASRAKNAKRLGLATQYVDQTMDDGDNAPLGLETENGGALVFFGIRYFERQTAAQGYRPKVDADVKALMTGEVKNTVTKEWVSDQAALVKPASGATDKDAVAIAGRLQGVTGAKGE
ncbi:MULTISPECIES: hypothetical protein [Streptomyces]|uniref:DUF8094 domain-containing protein n=1 Tax=Streptomyces solicathayae TaxID=3081768 RepID=A0ABZ0LYV1_9ACTN|nr:hypothetical protein [Streptomyces sp. HUAS YS2]WOX24699.1 hypothetical protein R2D22_26290 [Streptomyces sp. HUAS YS2]